MSLFTQKRRTLLWAVALLAVGAVYWSGCGGDNSVTPPDITRPGGGGVTPPDNWDGDTIIDGRDGQIYKTVAIGGKVWMAQNLNYKPLTGASYCYGNADSNCVKYGRLYTWSTAMAGAASSALNPSGVQGVCPSGWHLPSRREWGDLAVTAGGTGEYGTGGEAGKKLKSRSGWIRNSSGTDDFGFTALPGGWMNSSGAFNRVGENSVWWTAEASGSQAGYRGIIYDTDYIEEKFWPQGSGFSVRCVLDGDAPPVTPPVIYEDGILEGLPFRKGEIPAGTEDLLKYVDMGNTIISGGSVIVTVSSPVKLKYLYINVDGDSELGYYVLDLSQENPSVANGFYTYKPTLLISQNLEGGETLRIKLGGASADDRTSKTVDKYVSTLEVGSGSLQVSLSWNNSDDLDLHIVTPSGEIYYRNKIAGNGELDLDANVGCGGKSNENIYFDGTLGNGLYLVWVDLYTKCGEEGAEYNVTASAGGKPFSFSENSQRERGSFLNSDYDHTGVPIGVITVKNGAIVKTDYNDPAVIDIIANRSVSASYGFYKKKK